MLDNNHFHVNFAEEADDWCVSLHLTGATCHYYLIDHPEIVPHTGVCWRVINCYKHYNSCCLWELIMGEKAVVTRFASGED